MCTPFTKFINSIGRETTYFVRRNKNSDSSDPVRCPLAGKPCPKYVTQLHLRFISRGNKYQTRTRSPIFTFDVPALVVHDPSSLFIILNSWVVGRVLVGLALASLSCATVISYIGATSDYESFNRREISKIVTPPSLVRSPHFPEITFLTRLMANREVAD